MRYIAIDLGEKRTGLASGDNETNIVTPLDVLDIGIAIAGGNALIEAIGRAVDDQFGQRDAGELVIGLPLNMDGTEGPAVKHVRAFAARLAERTNRQIHFQDERLTSVDAEWTLSGSCLTHKQKK